MCHTVPCETWMVSGLCLREPVWSQKVASTLPALGSSRRRLGLPGIRYRSKDFQPMFQVWAAQQRTEEQVRSLALRVALEGG